jgi:Zn-dependent protease with chaperone function
VAGERIDESALRHPYERLIFVGLVVLNFLLMGVAIALVVHDPGWLKPYPFLRREVNVLRFLAITALIGIPVLVLRRNRREASVRGNSVRLSTEQFPEIYAILEGHCRRLGMAEIPELFLSGSSIAPFSKAYSSWRENYIVLHQIIFDIDVQKTADVAAFTLGHELGAIRLNHTAVWNEMLLTYVSTIKWLRNPLERVRMYSRDRYGATLSPTGFRGLLISAIGRRLMDQVNVEEYLLQARRYGGIWAMLEVFFEAKPQVLSRIQQLRAAGFKYERR